MNKWINNHTKMWDKDDVIKPCHKLNFCPYGTLVEEFPLPDKRNEFSCKIFGHECPVFYHAEFITEEKK